MQSSQVLIAILGMGLITLACRFLPFGVMGRIQLSSAVVAWMRYLPVAVLSAVVIPQILLAQGDVCFGPVSRPLVASLFTVGVAALTRNLLAGVTIGVACIALLRAI